jgi:hypothetical protein
MPGRRKLKGNFISMKCAMTCALIALLISLGPTGGSAASHRLDVQRCIYPNCFTSAMPRNSGQLYRRRPIGSEKLRRNRPTEDAVSRLQAKIARDRAKDSSSATARRSYSYSAIGRPFPHSPFPDISCREGRLLVQGQGFSRVSALECQGTTFTYLARENGKMVRVIVDARYGRIISTRPY